MYLLRSLLALPTPLLLLLSSGSGAQALDLGLAPVHGGLDHPPHLKYFPEDHLIRRHNDEAIEEHIHDGNKPIVVRKMSEDEGEMFFPEYWGFQERDAEISRPSHSTERGIYDDLSQSLRREYKEEDDRLVVNASAQFSLRPAFAIHENPPIQPPDLIKARARDINAAGALAALQKKAFQCPGGTSACLSISQPNYCCAASEDCVIITDTGLGPVGCCPSGGSCLGEIKACAAGQTACPQSMGGACCVAGYTCFDVGCVSSVVVTSIQTVTQSQSTSSSILAPTTTTAAACGGAADYTPCPANLGGGCCLTGRICTTGTSCPLPGDFSTTGAPAPPVRGTGEGSNTPAPTSIASGDACPTGFYACSAYYPGAGCCRIGRDCSQTFCPSTDSVTVVSAGKTIAVPLVPDATTTAGGSCASGWASCAADVGGNCCPSGWVCGSQSCSSADVSSTAVVGKEQVALNSSRHVTASRAFRLMIVMAGVSGLLIQ